MISFPLCMQCKRKITSKDRVACEAFPDGIPTDILEGIFDHNNLHEGDHGIKFEKL